MTAVVSAENLLFTNPVFQPKIWGGRKLQTEWGYDIPEGAVGECWAISAHPNGDCTLASGTWEGTDLTGMHLSEVWEQHRDLFGAVGGSEFPLLIKILDAAGNLSIQVHPDDAYAAVHEGGSLGKMECWYVLAAAPYAHIVYGQNAHDAAEFERLVEAGNWHDLLHEMPVEKGDFFQVAPGTVHALCEGTMVLETQQSSDVTYRVYDYDRVQDDGTKRELHLAQSLEVIDYAQNPPASGAITTAEKNGVTHLESCEYYTVERVRAGELAQDGVGATALEVLPTFMCVSVVEGSGAIAGTPVAKGSHCVVPAGKGQLALEGSLELIVSWPPAE